MEIKDKILEGAEGLFMRYGIKSVTMDDIARELGISKKTLYQYVDNKGDLIQQIFGCRKEEEQAEMAEIHQAATDAIDEILRIAKSVLRRLRGMSQSALYDLQKYYGRQWKAFELEHQQYIYQVLKRNIEDGMKQGLYRENLDPDIVSKLYVGKTSLVADEELFPLSDYNLEALFRQYMLYHIHGIASLEGLKVLEKHMDRNLEHID